jgi:hypothetical protein
MRLTRNEKQVINLLVSIKSVPMRFIPPETRKSLIKKGMAVQDGGFINPTNSAKNYANS